MSFVSTFGSFTTARLGIYAAQKGLSVTGNNIANINTRGYTRQTLDQISLRSSGAERYQSQSACRVGNGVLPIGVSQIRDPYLDIRYRNEMSAVGAADAKLAGLEDLAAVLDEVAKGGDENGIIEAQLSELYKALQNLSINTNQNGYDTQVRTAAEALVTLFNSYAGRLETVKETSEKGFQQNIDTVNKLLSNIRDLNATIRKSEIHGDSALELRDERNRLIDELSQYMKIDVLYSMEDLGGGEMVEKLTIRLPGVKVDGKDVNLVDGIYARELSAAGPNYDLSLSEMKDAKQNTLAGSAAVALDDNALYGALQSAREMLTEKGEFSSADDLARDPGAATKRGIPYYQKTLDLLANKLAATFNQANKGYQMNQDGSYVDDQGAVIMLAGEAVGRGALTDAQKAELAQNGQTLDEFLLASGAVKMGGNLFSNGGNSDSGAGITAANISVSKGWANGDVRIVSSFIQGGGSTESSNLLHMISLMDKKLDFRPGSVDPLADSKAPLFHGTFQEMLCNIGTVLGKDQQSTTILLNNYHTAAVELDTSRDSVSGVDLNDEASNLMQYQKSYAAACRLMTTLDEALDKLINGTGVVGR